MMFGDELFRAGRRIVSQLDSGEQPDIAFVTDFLESTLSSLDGGGDFESMHSDEDVAMGLVIRLVSDQVYPPDVLCELAKIVRKMNELDFTRWYA